ncbi:MAG: diguanylate cyclase, partial [Planctomycetaceae bacterium]|nr:diguanylate cyclase [Planctomycetaceae bacterium]
LIAGLIGLVPDRAGAVMQGRARLCQSAGISFTLLATRDDFSKTQLGLEALVQQSPELLSAAVRQTDGKLVARVGNHEQRWNDPAIKELNGAQMFVPIQFNGERWGALEFCFEPLERGGWLGQWFSESVRLPWFVMLITGVGSWFYLRRVLHYLDPSRVVPARVRQALDTLTEGLLLLDKDERIVLANRAFVETAGIDEKKLLGRKASALPWQLGNGDAVSTHLPWQQVLSGEQDRHSSMLNLKPPTEEVRTFMVNAAPILDDRGRSQGALTSFGDVTPLENKKAELAKMLETLQISAVEITRQNQELERLATEDPLTGCWNRRSFFASFESAWTTPEQTGLALSCVMIDIDFFKSINDRFGHSTGDEVLRVVAATLKKAARREDFVCRYGGEEFCIVMRDTDLAAATQNAERLRQAVAAIQHPKLSVTASLGVSCRSLGAHSPQELLDQADKCLYVAKQTGRNRVVSFDAIPSDLVIDQAKTSRAKPQEPLATEQPIPFHAVVALTSALAYRDLTTAEHSRRVADLCVNVADGLMSPSQSYLLEIAALLHDIGKIGVPDAVLLKAEALTPDERELMRTHQRQGRELLRASFKSPELCAILEHHATPPNAKLVDPKTGQPMSVPLASRILAISDSFDSMVNDSVYRKARTRDEAFAELRRCAGTQFDAELVERFIVCVMARQADKREVGQVSNEAALAIGQEIERLVLALDRRDLTGLRDIAGHMNRVAAKQGATTVATQAAGLEAALISEDSDLLAVLHEANELLKLCRQTQRTDFDGSPLRTSQSPSSRIPNNVAQVARSSR